ncbi:MAG: branched-chain amino acid ABC transporter permease [Hyphomicrobiaceae bacterium]
MRGCTRALASVAAIVVLALLLGACARVVDAEEARVCRHVIAGLEGGTARIEVQSVRPVSRAVVNASGPGAGVAISYRLVGVVPGMARPSPRTVTCLFDPSRPSQKPAERILSIETPDGPLAASRIYMLKRFWLDTIPGTIDPEPVPGADRVPEVARGVAVSVQALISGLPQMALLPLLAAAYALVYGLVGRINLAFGDLVTAGGYAALIGIAAVGGSDARVALVIAAAVIVALWAGGMISAAMGRVVFEPLHTIAGQTPLIASAGLAIVLAETVRLAKTGGPKSGPPILNDPVALLRSGDFIVTVTPVAVVVAALSALAMAALLVALSRSGLGRAWRAASDDPLAASLMGVSPTAIHAVTFAVSGLLAGLGGAIAAVTYGSIAYAGGLMVGLKALIAALLAGSGAIGRAALCGLAIAVVEALWSAALPIEHRDAMLFTGLVVILVVRSSLRTTV